jgi:hypothetical protein
VRAARLLSTVRLLALLIMNKNVRFGDVCEVREDFDIKKRPGDLGLGDSKYCDSPKRGSVLVADVWPIICPWDSGMGQAEVVRKVLRLEIEVMCECNDREIGSQQSDRKMVFWRDDERVVVFEPPRPLDIANGESPTQDHCSIIGRHEAARKCASNPITFSARDRI